MKTLHLLPDDSQSAHFWPGWLDVGFVLSAPGTFEASRLKPAFGVTGAHLDLALTRHLVPALPGVFPSAHRYDYRITNAYASPLSHARGDGRTEADDADIRIQTNADRVRDELAGCRLVVLCGAKAALLKYQLPDLAVVVAGHTSMSGLNSRWQNTRQREHDQSWDAKSGDERTAGRIALWAHDVETQVRALVNGGGLQP